MSDLIPFEFEANHVRVIIDETNNPWFVAKDVAKALGYVWNGQARIAHVPAEWRGVTSDVTPGGKQSLLTLSEQGLYFFVARSDKPKALPFQRWLAGEVLPSIRKTGQYQVQTSPTVKILHDPVLQALSVMLAELDAVKQEQQEQRELGQSLIKRDRQRARDQAELTHRLDAIETAIEYFTIIGWWSLNYSESLPTEDAARYGRIAAKYCRKHGYKIGKTTDSRYGRVNIYPKEVLDILFLD